MRHWGRLLGGYDGETEDEKYWADAINDIVVDCKFCHSFFLELAEKPKEFHGRLSGIGGSYR